jgi:hypothetical protein
MVIFAFISLNTRLNSLELYMVNATTSIYVLQRLNKKMVK